MPLHYRKRDKGLLQREAAQLRTKARALALEAKN
jgi:hypothetical protein